MNTVLPIILTVHDHNGDEIQRKELDHANKNDRVNIAKTCWWAMRMGYSVTTVPVDRTQPEKEVS